ncbi:MAG: hypothetical protein CMJ19_20965 [Phycisphaeraceae bacterium]|nr:hypothetical protein [Phycisphaeraceae bacterium]|tara:strand:+ start:31 stop:537 length:507 start_codon:yes stop_codon:yes gene_type:complete
MSIIFKIRKIVFYTAILLILSSLFGSIFRRRDEVLFNNVIELHWMAFTTLVGFLGFGGVWMAVSISLLEKIFSDKNLKGKISSEFILYFLKCLSVCSVLLGSLLLVVSIKSLASGIVYSDIVDFRNTFWMATLSFLIILFSYSHERSVVRLRKRIARVTDNETGSDPV